MALREILVHFGFDFDGAAADAADKKVKKVKTSADESARGVDALQGAWQALLAVGVLRGVQSWVDGITNQAEALGQLSEITGLSTHDLQVWRFGAAKAGQDAEVFTLALRKLSAAAAGGVDETGSQSKVFEKLGIKTKDAQGKVKSLAELLPEIANHFQGMSDGTAKAALAQELFGRSGTKLIPLLNQGADGVAKLSSEFDKLGGGFDPAAIQNAAEMKVAIARIGVAWDGVSSQLAVSLLPRIADLLEGTTHLVVQFKDFASQTTLLDNAFDGLAIAIGVTLWGALAPFLFGVIEFVAVYAAVDDLTGFLNGKSSEIGDILDSWFGDGTAEAVRDWTKDAESSVVNLWRDMQAVWPLVALDVAELAVEVEGTWNSMILSLEGAYNGFVRTVLGNNTTIEIDTRSKAQDVQNNADTYKALEATRLAAESRVASYAEHATAPTTQANVAVGPLRPGNTQSWNTIENKQTINIQIPAGTPEAQARALARQVRDVNREQHRTSLQALENQATGGG